MIITMLTGLYGPHLLLQPGDTYECSEDEGRRLIAAGFAVLAEPLSPPKREKAVRRRKAAEKRG